MNNIGCVMVNLLSLSVLDHGFKPQSGKTTDYAIGICCFSAKLTALRSKSKGWMAWNQSGATYLSMDWC
jgi:hypothetical protein